MEIVLVRHSKPTGAILGESDEKLSVVDYILRVRSYLWTHVDGRSRPPVSGLKLFLNH